MLKFSALRSGRLIKMADIIGFSGPSGSGKTTLVSAVADKLKELGYRVGIISEVAREVFEKFSRKYGFQSLREIRQSDMFMAFQATIMKVQALKEHSLQRYDIVLTDRTLYDNLLYTLFWFNPFKHSTEELDEYCAYFDMYSTKDYELDDMTVRVPKYDKIFLCEPLDSREVVLDDGFRTDDLSYRCIQFFLLRKLLPFYTFVPAMPLQPRVEFVVEEILDDLERQEVEANAEQA